VPAVRDKFGSSQKRLGRKRAVVASIASDAGPITFAQAHLDSNADTKQRSTQLGLRASSPQVVRLAKPTASDHDPIVVDLAVS
jgi:hypothetical protein